MSTQKNCIRAFLIFFCFVAVGCTGKQIGREFENAMGTLGRKEIQSLGAPGKNVSLAQRVITGEYAVIVPKYILHLGDEFTEVRVPKQFSDGNADYAVLACVRENGTIKNVLLTIPPQPNDARIFLLDSSSNKPFSVDVTRHPTTLKQESDSPGIFTAWYLISPSTIRGPATVSPSLSSRSTNGARNKRKADTSSTAHASVPKPSLPPVINPDTSVRLESKQTTANDSAASTAPDGDTPAPADTSPTPAAPSPAQRKPVIILRGDTTSQPQAAGKTAP